MNHLTTAAAVGGKLLLDGITNWFGRTNAPTAPAEVTFASHMPDLALAAGLETDDLTDARWRTVVRTADGGYPVYVYPAGVVGSMSRIVFARRLPALEDIRREVNRGGRFPCDCRVLEAAGQYTLSYARSIPLPRLTPAELTRHVDELAAVAWGTDSYIRKLAGG